jgi:hypothetical protein
VLLSTVAPASALKLRRCSARAVIMRPVPFLKANIDGVSRLAASAGGRLSMRVLFIYKERCASQGEQRAGDYAA